MPACLSNNKNISKFYRELGVTLNNLFSDYLSTNEALIEEVNDFSLGVNSKKEDFINCLDDYIEHIEDCCFNINKELDRIIYIFENIPCIIPIDRPTSTTIKPTTTSSTTSSTTSTTKQPDTTTTEYVEEMCDEPTIVNKKGSFYPYVINKFLGKETGLVTLTYESFSIPDRFVVIFDGKIVIDTGYIGLPIFQSRLNAAVAAKGDVAGAIDPVTSGSVSFMKDTAFEYATVYVYAPLNNTAFEFILSCPEELITTTEEITTTTEEPTTTTVIEKDLIASLSYVICEDWDEDSTMLPTTTPESCDLPEGAVADEPIVVSIEYNSPVGLVVLSKDLETLASQLVYYKEHLEDVIIVNTSDLYYLMEYGEEEEDDIKKYYGENGCCLPDGHYAMIDNDSIYIISVEDCIESFFVSLNNWNYAYVDSIEYDDIGEVFISNTYNEALEEGCYAIENADKITKVNFKELYFIEIEGEPDDWTIYIFDTDGNPLPDGFYLTSPIPGYTDYYFVEYKDNDEDGVMLSELCINDPEGSIAIGTLDGWTNTADSFDNGDPDNFAQSFDIRGEIYRISILATNSWAADFKIRAKLYYDIPEHLDTNFPLSNLIAQSTNTIDVRLLSRNEEKPSKISFYFDSVQVTDKFICVFEYENVIAHSDMGAGCVRFYYKYEGTPYEDYMIFIGDLGFWVNKSLEDHQFMIELAYKESTTTTVDTTTIEPTTTVPNDTTTIDEGTTTTNGETTTTEYCCELLNFNTNKSGYFAPKISYDEDLTSHWNLGDGGDFVGNTVDHSYDDDTVKSVTMCLPLSCDCTLKLLKLDIKNIIGLLNLSKFTDMNEMGVSIDLSQNSALTSVSFASSITGTLGILNISASNLTGTLDISMFAELSSSGAEILLGLNSLLEYVTFSNSITGVIKKLNIEQCDLQGILDLSMFDTIHNSETSIHLSSNSDLENVTFASSITGKIYELYIASCNIDTSIDLSMFEELSTTGAWIDLSDNSLLESITFAESITGKLQSLRIWGCDIQGNLDISMFEALHEEASEFMLHNNPDMTGITFAETVTGSLYLFTAYGCDLQSLDLSVFANLSDEVVIKVYENSSLSSLVMPDASDPIRELSAYSCDLGYVDFTGNANMLNVNNAWIQLQNNNMIAAEVNHILYDLANLVSGEQTGGDYTNRAINVSGTNATPDSSSGGYNGLTAVSDLEDKGITVVITNPL